MNWTAEDGQIVERLQQCRAEIMQMLQDRFPEVTPLVAIALTGIAGAVTARTILGVAETQERTFELLVTAVRAFVEPTLEGMGMVVEGATGVVSGKATGLPVPPLPPSQRN
jgi:hypothetical protein